MTSFTGSVYTTSDGCFRLYRCGVGGIKLPPPLAFKSTLWQASFPGHQRTPWALYVPPFHCTCVLLKSFKCRRCHQLTGTSSVSQGSQLMGLTPQNINKRCIQTFIHRETGTSTGWETNSGTHLIRLLVKPYSITSFFKSEFSLS